MNDAQTLARALYRALEAGEHGPALRPLFHDDAYTLEHPNLIKPRGARIDAARMLQESASGAALLASQRYAIHSVLEVGDTAIIRFTWTGVVARAAGPFQSGQTLTAHIAQFVTAHDGRIASIETYDCYEPFA